jgi:hypothetical protein
MQSVKDYRSWAILLGVLHAIQKICENVYIFAWNRIYSMQIWAHALAVILAYLPAYN